MSEAIVLTLIVLAIVGVSLAGLALVRWKAPTDRLKSITDVAGYIYAIIGVIYAVILAFVVIAAWEEYRDAQAVATTEASAVLNLARIANGWPAGDRANVEATLITYAKQVVEVEWPAMARGDFTPTIDTIALNQIWQSLNMADESARTESASYQAAWLQLENLGESRRNRLLLGQESLPMALTLILVVGAVVTVAFTFLFAVDDGWLHALMTASVALLVALPLVMQYQLEMPFQGISAIEPTAMELTLAEIDSATGIPGMSP